MRSLRTLILAGAVVAGGLFLASCSGDKVAQSDVEDEISTQLESQLGAAPEVSCPGDLTAEVDETMNCEVTAEGETLTVTVTVTSVDGDQANFNIELAE